MVLGSVVFTFIVLGLYLRYLAVLSLSVLCWLFACGTWQCCLYLYCVSSLLVVLGSVVFIFIVLTLCLWYLAVLFLPLLY